MPRLQRVSMFLRPLQWTRRSPFMEEHNWRQRHFWRCSGLRLLLRARVTYTTTSSRVAEHCMHQCCNMGMQPWSPLCTHCQSGVATVSSNRKIVVQSDVFVTVCRQFICLKPRAHIADSKDWLAWFKKAYYIALCTVCVRCSPNMADHCLAHCA